MERQEVIEMGELCIRFQARENIQKQRPFQARVAPHYKSNNYLPY